MSSVLTINGSTVTVGDQTGNIVLTRLVVYSKDSTPTFQFQARGIVLPDSDPYLNKSTSLSISGTLRFAGRVVEFDDDFTDIGWVRTYTCYGYRWLADRCPVWNDSDTTDTLYFNLQPDDPNYLAARAGRSVGQIITTILTQVGLANKLNAYGIGGYTGLPTTPALPAATVTDLAALATIPPIQCVVGGEKSLTSIQGWMSSVAPNTSIWIDPTNGNIRFIDLRTFVATTLTLGVDPIDPPKIKRSVVNTFSRVVVRGSPLALPVTLSTQDGTLAEDFAHDALSNSAAKAAWTYNDFAQTNTATDYGTISSMGSTTTITVHSANASATWSSNYWDQSGSGAHGWIVLIYTVDASYNSSIFQTFTARIVSNTSLSAGGTSVITIDSPAPITTYNLYKIYGLQQGGSVVWTRYSIPNTAIAAAITNQFTFPVPFVNSSGTAATLTSYPMADILWGTSNAQTSGPWFDASLPFVADPTTGTIRFPRPLITLTDPVNENTAGGYVYPWDVRALCAVNYGALTVTSPADSGGPVYAGTSHSVDGMSETLYIMVPDWRDYSNTTSMAIFTADQLDSVKDTILEGECVYYGLYTGALTFGTSLNIAGSTFDTPWDTTRLPGGIPVVECEISWLSGPGATINVTSLRLSNRRSQFTGSTFVHPAIRGATLGTQDGEETQALGGQVSVPTSTGVNIANSVASQATGSANQISNQSTGLANQVSNESTGSATTGTGAGNQVSNEALGAGGIDVGGLI